MKRDLIVALTAVVSVLLAAPPLPGSPHGGSSPAAAQPADDSAAAAKVPVARRLYEEGVEAVGQGRWSVAHDRFKASYELAPRVLTLFNLAGAQAQTSRYIEASESYRRFLRETADGRYADLRAEATRQLESIEKQVAQITLDVARLERDDVLAVDGVEFPHVALREPIPLNPGPHVVTVSRRGEAIAKREITLAPGAAEVVRIELPVQPIELRPRAPEAAPPRSAQLPTPAPERPLGARLVRSPWLWAAAAVVVVGGAAGAYLLTRPGDDVLVVR